MSRHGRLPIRVLQVIAALDPVAGGPPASAVATSLALRSRGVVNSFAYVDGPGLGIARNAERLVAAGIAIHGFPITKGTGALGVRWGVSLRLAVWLLRNAHRFDVLHTHGAWTFTTAASLVAARFRRRIAVLSAHESLTDFDRQKSGALHSKIKQVLRWFYLRSFNVVVVASRLEQRDMKDPAGLRSVVVPHAVTGVSGVSRSPSNGNELRVGFLGRLHPKKNLELLIDALAALPSGVSLHVAGDGPSAYRESLISRAQSRGVDMRIHWCGFVEDAAKPDFLGSVDVLVMPSAFECFGVAAVEGLSAGLPVIVSHHVGVADVVREYRCGRVVAAVAPEVTSALRELMVDVSARRLLSENARLAASREFSIRAHGERLTAEYEGALGARGHHERSRA